MGDGDHRQAGAEAAGRDPAGAPDERVEPAVAGALEAPEQAHTLTGKGTRHGFVSAIRIGHDRV
jgi:hypothetical protein